MGYLMSKRRKCLWLVGCFITFAETKFSSGKKKKGDGCNGSSIYLDLEFGAALEDR